jgi:RHS repeat-associated protein
LAFGEERIYDAAGNLLEESALGNRWRFASKRVDSETGLVYFGRRYYQPATGRWISPDPIGREGGPNLYAYVLNRSLTSYDPYGLFASGGGYNNPFAGLLQGSFDFMRTCVSYVGEAIYQLGFHFVPVPLVRDVMQLGGLALAGSGFDRFYPAFTGKSSHGDLGLPETYQKSRFLDALGLGNRREDGIRQAEATSQEHGGCNVHYYVASTDGILLDLVKAGIRRCGIPLPEDREFADLVQSIHDQMGGSQADTVIHVQAHSQGAILTDNLKRQLGTSICKRLDVTTYGAGKLLDPEDFYDAANICSTRDGVPFFTNPIAYTCARVFGRDDVVFLKSNYFPFCDHAMAGETYEKARRKNANSLREFLQGTK